MENKIQIDHIRTDYQLAVLDESQVDQDPMNQFTKWFDEALKAEVMEVNAMTLATVDADGNPNARIVLLKDIETEAFVFYTNYESAKGHEIASHPFVTLLFFWPELQRQVRIKGPISKVSPADSDHYFHSRPIGSQLGAWASPQSASIDDRSALEIKLKEVTDRFSEGQIPRPPYWGGYQVKPLSLEFWQGRSNRLHDRILYTQEDQDWTISRLAP